MLGTFFENLRCHLGIGAKCIIYWYNGFLNFFDIFSIPISKSLSEWVLFPLVQAKNVNISWSISQQLPLVFLINQCFICQIIPEKSLLIGIVYLSRKKNSFSNCLGQFCYNNIQQQIDYLTGSVVISVFSWKIQSIHILAIIPSLL